MKYILLTFDLEEFDLSKNIQEKEQFKISIKGLSSVLNLLEKYNIKSTFFTTTHLAKNNINLIKQMHKDKHEIACHGYNHSDSYLNDLSKIPIAKQEIEEIIKEKIKGFRAPRFNIKKIHKLFDFGFSYDSSIHPTFTSSRARNLFNKKSIHKIGKIIEIPPSVLPFIRTPISWIFFKNIPTFYSKTFTRINSLSSDYTMIYLHPWEFANLSKINIPKYIKRKHSKELLDLLEEYILFCKNRKYKFDTISNYLEKNF